MCAGNIGESAGTSKYDKGGPLACKTSDGRWTLAGIVSYAESYGAADKYVMYSRMSYFEQWINQVTGGPYDREFIYQL